MSEKKLAVFFPGTGYNKDKPLLYYSRKIAKTYGYEELILEYNNLPDNLKGNEEKMKEAVRLAYEQCAQSLFEVDFSSYDKVIFIGKSIGTVIAAKYAADNGIKAGKILYTPVEATFMWQIDNAVAFIGDADSWSDVDNVKKLAEERGVALHVFPDCNHSLESNHIHSDLDIFKNVMKTTNDFVKDYL